MPVPPAARVPALMNVATRLRIDSVRSTSEAGSGHPTTCCSAADIMAAPVVPQVVEAMLEIARVAGVSTALRYRGEVSDLHALVRHVVAHPEHVNLLAPNGPAINALARSLREACNIPGVKVVCERDVRVRQA